MTTMNFLAQYHLTGLVIGAATFLIIGVFHPIVVKTHYRFGTCVWWVFLAAGLGAVAGSLWVGNVVVSSLLGVLGFTCFWTIKELFEQEERVRKGWFPENPKHKHKNN